MFVTLLSRLLIILSASEICQTFATPPSNASGGADRFSSEIGSGFIHELLVPVLRDVTGKKVGQVEHNEAPTSDDMLEFFEKSLISYGEDMLQQCVDEVDVKSLVDSEIRKVRRLLRHLVIVTIAVLSFFFLLHLGVIVYLCRSQTRKIKPSLACPAGRSMTLDSYASTTVTNGNHGGAPHMYREGDYNPTYELDMNTNKQS